MVENLPLYAFLLSFVLSILQDHVDWEKHSKHWKHLIWFFLLASLGVGVWEIVSSQIEARRERAFERYVELEAVFEKTRSQNRVGDFHIDDETWSVLNQDLSARIAGRMLEGLAREAAAYGNSRVNDCYCTADCETACGIPSPVGSTLPPHLREKMADSVVLHVLRPGGTVIGSSIGAEPTQIQCTQIKDGETWDEASETYGELEKALRAYPGWKGKDVDDWNQAPRFAVVRAARNLGYFVLCDALRKKPNDQLGQEAERARYWFDLALRKAELIGANARSKDLEAKLAFAELLVAGAEIVTVRDTRYVQEDGLPVEGFGVAAISKQMERRMTGVSWKPHLPCPALSSLRVVYLRHWTFDGTVRSGHLVVAADVATSVLNVFTELYENRFPIEEVSPADFRGADDDRLMADNITSAFNCRTKTDKPNELSDHALGRAIDINPLQNPYVKDDRVLPPAGKAFLGQHEACFPANRGVVNGAGTAVAAFRKEGWRWGGTWKTHKDWQHFEAPTGIPKDAPVRIESKCSPVEGTR